MLKLSNGSSINRIALAGYQWLCFWLQMLIKVFIYKWNNQLYADHLVTHTNTHPQSHTALHPHITSIHPHISAHPHTPTHPAAHDTDIPYSKQKDKTKERNGNNDFINFKRVTFLQYIQKPSVYTCMSMILLLVFKRFVFN